MLKMTLKGLKSTSLVAPTTAFLNRRCPWLIVSLASAACSTGLMLSGGTAFMEQYSYNLLHQLRQQFHPLDWDDRIVVAAIDENSLATYGRFPFPRDRYTQFLDQLLAPQPAAITFDILMPESTSHDGQFAQAIVENSNVVLAIANDGYGNSLEIPPAIAHRARGSFATGYVNNWPDADGISRRISLSQGEGTQALSIATLKTYLTSISNTQRDSLTTTAYDSSVIAETNSPAIAQEAWLNWPGPVPMGSGAGSGSGSSNASLKVISFADIAEGRFNSSMLQNKIVLVGVTALGVDPMRTPFHHKAPTSGVFLHAAILDNLLNQRFLNPLPQKYGYLILLAVSGLTGYLLHGLGATSQIALYIGFPMVWLGIVYGAFLMQWWMPLAMPIVGVWFTIAGTQLQAQRDKQQLMNLFAMSVAPETAKVIWQRKQEIFDQGEIAAQELTATILFMDIRNFTSIAEELSSTVLLDWLNQYFDVMTGCIMDHGGVVDKYIGDAIMAVFGAPFPRTTPEQIQQDAIAAIHASLQMHEKLTELNQFFAQNNLPTVNFGIGIHTGPLVAGTVGNRNRMSYSLFGDTVNVAARIESRTKDLPVELRHRILISSNTQARVDSQFETQIFCSTALRGRGTETRLYNLAD